MTVKDPHCIADIVERRQNINTVEKIMLFDGEAWPFFASAPKDIDRLFAVIGKLEAELQECRTKSGTYLDPNKIPHKKRPNLVIDL